MRVIQSLDFECLHQIDVCEISEEMFEIEEVSILKKRL